MSLYATPFEMQQPRTCPAGLAAICVIPIVFGALGFAFSLMENEG